jgi:hypothetical protein
MRYELTDSQAPSLRRGLLLALISPNGITGGKANNGE